MLAHRSTIFCISIFFFFLSVHCVCNGFTSTPWNDSIPAPLLSSSYLCCSFPLFIHDFFLLIIWNMLSLVYLIVILDHLPRHASNGVLPSHSSSSSSCFPSSIPRPLNTALQAIQTNTHFWPLSFSRRLSNFLFLSEPRLAGRQQIWTPHAGGKNYYENVVLNLRAKVALLEVANVWWRRCWRVWGTCEWIPACGGV